MRKFVENLKSEVRFEREGVVLYNPKEDKKTELIELIKKEQSLDINDDEISEEIVPNVVRYVLRNFTNYGEEIDNYTDDEIMEVLSNPNRTIELLCVEIGVLIDEIVEDIFINVRKDFRNIESTFRTLDVMDMEKDMYDKLAKTLKKQGINVTADELINFKGDENELAELLSKKTKKKKRK